MTNVRPIHLELKEGAMPQQAWLFPVSQPLRNTTKKEVQQLGNIGVSKRNNNSEWAAPQFAQPKKARDVRIPTDFRKSNDAIKQKPFPLPKTLEPSQRLCGFKCAAAIDLSMGCCHVPLDEASQKLCTAVFSWGKHRHKQSPMGIKNSPDIFQALMLDLSGDLECTSAHINGILIASDGSFEDHSRQVGQVLKCLETAGFRTNV